MDDFDFDDEPTPKWTVQIKNIRTGAMIKRTSEGWSGEDAANNLINSMKEPSNYAIFSYTRVAS